MKSEWIRGIIKALTMYLRMVDKKQSKVISKAATASVKVVDITTKKKESTEAAAKKVMAALEKRKETLEDVQNKKLAQIADQSLKASDEVTKAQAMESVLKQLL